ncbi:unnamed protein product [Scytosiphon promiscuus]
MRERPWEGQLGRGTAQDWAEWLEHLEPTLERHLRWLTVDGLAVELGAADGRARGETRFVALAKPLAGSPFYTDGVEVGERLRVQAEEVAAAGEPGGQESAGRLAAPVAGGRAAAAGGAAGPGAGTLAGGPSMLAGGMRIMKSRPIKMVKPWR